MAAPDDYTLQITTDVPRPYVPAWVGFAQPTPAHAADTYGKDWSLLVPGLLVIGVLALVGTIIIPFYRQAVGMSAYEYFGKRFGRPRLLASNLGDTYVSHACHS